MAIWPFAKSLGVLIIYVLIYGFTAGGFISLFPVVVATIVKAEDLDFAMGIISISQFFGMLFGTPASGALLDAAGHNYFTPLIEFTGACTVMAALIVAYLRFTASTKFFAKI
ncbi:uncharacterized protein VTP21DRAFT_2920 [Calcarisporiella thermophila]|uniref:uncharacterized protein n=1 Tax=Calcarisporiella thermophila TaxID=911321 RepID=UPI0037428DBE